MVQRIISVTDCSSLYRIRTPSHSGNCSHRYLFTHDNAYTSWMGPCLFSEFDETASDELDEDDGNVIGAWVCVLVVYVQTLYVLENLSTPELMKNRKRPAESPPSKAAKTMKLGSDML